MGHIAHTRRAVMSTKLKLAVVSTALLLFAGSANAGCGKGAAAGAVVGHVAGKHGVAGAAVGCAIGHHSAKKKKAAATAASTGTAPAADAAEAKK
jgi:hypothetical protein